MLKFPRSVGPCPPPPRLDMNEYADTIQYLLDATDPARARAQKEFEEQIKVPFSLRMCRGSRQAGGPGGPPGRAEDHGLHG